LKKNNLLSKEVCR